MKNSLIYGCLLTLTAFLVTLILFLCGLQSDPAHAGLGKAIGGIAGLAIAIGFLVAGIKAQRRTVSGPFTYGQAVGAGVLVQLVASLLSIATTWLYAGAINHPYFEAIYQQSLDKMRERGLSEDQIDKASHFLRWASSPPFAAAGSFIGTMIFGAIIVLIAAAFLQRQEAEVENPKPV